MIPTAEEFLDDYIKKENIPWNQDVDKYYGAINTAMIEFAKMHVKKAIRECIESAPSGSSTDTVSYEDVVECLIDCYPETNIK